VLAAYLAALTAADLVITGYTVLAKTGSVRWPVLRFSCAAYGLAARSRDRR